MVLMTSKWLLILSFSITKYITYNSHLTIHVFTEEDIISAFALPESTLVGQRIAKNLLVEHGANTAKDRKLIKSGVESIHCVAMLKPMATGISAWHDEIGEYLEIAFVRMLLRKGAKAQRITNLLHRAIPYPVVLFTKISGSNELNLSFSHKRLSQVGENQYILDGELLAVTVTALQSSFIKQYSVFALHKQNASDLRILYQRWMDHASALQASHITGSYQSVESMPQASVLRENVAQYHSKRSELEQLRSQIKKESQISKKVDINIRIQSLKKQIDALELDLRQS